LIMNESAISISILPYWITEFSYAESSFVIRVAALEN
jgi:hypothetical protein